MPFIGTFNSGLSRLCVGLHQINLVLCALVRKPVRGTRNMVKTNKTKAVREELDLGCHQISPCVCVLARSLLRDTRFGSRFSIQVHIVSLSCIKWGDQHKYMTFHTFNCANWWQLACSKRVKIYNWGLSQIMCLPTGSFKIDRHENIEKNAKKHV